MADATSSEKTGKKTDTERKKRGRGKEMDSLGTRGKRDTGDPKCEYGNQRQRPGVRHDKGESLSEKGSRRGAPWGKASHVRSKGGEGKLGNYHWVLGALTRDTTAPTSNADRGRGSSEKRGSNEEKRKEDHDSGDENQKH